MFFKRNNQNSRKTDFVLPVSGRKRYFLFYRDRFSGILKLGFLFLLFSLPIVTFPAAYAAANYVCLRIVNDRHVFIWDDFWHGFKANFWRCTLYGVLWALLLSMMVLSARATNALPIGGTMRIVLWVIYAISGLFLILNAVYFYAIQVWIDLPLCYTLRNSLLLPLIAMKNNWKILGIILPSLLILWLIFPLSVLLIPLLNGTIVYILNCVCYGGMEKYLIAVKDADKNETKEDEETGIALD